MLKAVVKNVELRVELSLRQLSGFKAAFANNHRTAEPARNQQRFVPILRCGAVRVDDSRAARFSPITAREDVKLEAALPQHFSKHHCEWRLPCASGRNASHADDRRR